MCVSRNNVTVLAFHNILEWSNCSKEQTNSWSVESGEIIVCIALGARAAARSVVRGARVDCAFRSGAGFNFPREAAAAAR